MAKLVTPVPESTPAEWGKRLALLACVLISVLLLLLLYLNEDKTRQEHLSWGDITLSAVPPMPAAEFLREVRAAGQFPELLNPNEPGLFERLGQACQRHDWVEAVARVALLGPHHLQIDLHFRVPVARLQRGTQFYLVDRLGKILLPLSPDQGAHLVALVGWDPRSSNDSEAMNWLAQAGLLAHRLQADLTAWQIVSIHLNRDPHLDTADLRLKTKAGAFIIWQSLKGPSHDEPAVEEKQSRLRVYHQRYGSLEAPPGQLLDVREREGLQRKPLQ